MIHRFLSTSFLAFSSAKGVVFFVPLLILWLEGREYYVMIEQVIAIALIVWPVVAFGMTAVYPFFTLEKKHFNFHHYFYKHLFISLVILLLFYSLSLMFFNIGMKANTTIFMVLLMVFSYFYSITYKCNNDVKTSSIFDAFPYFVIFLFIVSSAEYLLLVQFASVLLIVLLIYLVFKKLQEHSLQKRNITLLKFYLRKGCVSFLVSWLAIIVVMFPRAFIPEIMNAEQAESLYLSLRFAAVLVLIYQFLQISYYSKLYGIKNADFFKLWQLVWLVSVFILLVAMLFTQDAIVVWAIFYTFLWISTSFLELQVVRKVVQKQVLLNSLLFLPIMLFIFIFIDSFFAFAILSSAIFLIYILIQLISVFELNQGIKLALQPLLFFIFFGVAYV